MTQEKPRRENPFEESSLFIFSQKKQIYIFSRKIRLIFSKNFSIFVPHFASKIVLKISRFTCLQKSVLYGIHTIVQNVRNSTDLEIRAVVFQKFLDFRATLCLENRARNFAICVQKISLGIPANSQLINLPSLLHKYGNSLAL